MSEDTKRVGFIDEVRGLAILCMVVYHGALDLIIFNISQNQLFESLFFSFAMNTIRDIFAGMFVFISGAACRLSRSNLKRGLILAMIAAAVTLATFVFDVFSGGAVGIIRFGILHLLAFSMIFFSVTRRALDKLKPLSGSIIFGVVALVLYSATKVLQIDEAKLIPEMPLSQIIAGIFTIIFPSSGADSIDYFPLIPWIVIFIAGSYFGIYIKEKRLPDFFYKTRIPFLAWIGRRTIFVYLLHQPVIIGIIQIYLYLSNPSNPNNPV
ncbi:MAG: DUF1624 domain-containing protein [Oscillospiraceae bacterium]|nr:DUF1624 domain-containing protein [Oscillospiraceae bacterium]